MDPTSSTGGPAGVPTCYRHPGREAHIRCQRCERPICPDCMTAASVGFQCPECVREGRRSQRPLRTSFGGVRPSAPGLVTMVLLGINVVVWLLIAATGERTSRLVEWFALRAQGYCSAGNGGYYPGAGEAVCSAGGARWAPGVSDGAVWELLTSAFTHITLTHLFFNCLSLFVLGPQLEVAFGRARFIALYLLSALSGSALVYWTSDVGDTLGASGAVFGLMAAVLVVVLRTRTPAQGLLLWVGLSFAYSFVVPGISWQGHLGGFVGGLLVAAAIVWAPRRHRRRLQWAGIASVAVAIAVAVVLRSLTLA